MYAASVFTAYSFSTLYRMIEPPRVIWWGARIRSMRVSQSRYAAA